VVVVEEALLIVSTWPWQNSEINLRCRASGRACSEHYVSDFRLIREINTYEVVLVVEADLKARLMIYSSSLQEMSYVVLVLETTGF
jgi:hypothetical protein